MRYTIRYKRANAWLWKSITAVGHNYSQAANRMDFYYEDGTILSLGEWDKYDLRLGKDWVLATKARMEEEAGTEIKLKKSMADGE